MTEHGQWLPPPQQRSLEARYKWESKIETLGSPLSTFMVCVAAKDTFQVKLNGTWSTLILKKQVISLSHPF